MKKSRGRRRKWNILFNTEIQFEKFANPFDFNEQCGRRRKVLADD